MQEQEQQPIGQITHDAMCKAVFTLPGVLEAVLPLIWPQEVTTLFAGPAEPRDPVTIHQSLRQTIGDLLFRIPLTTGDYLYVPIEHKSAKERHTSYQLLTQRLAVWQEYGSAPTGPFPKVIPLIIYCGKRPWRTPASVAKLIPGKDAAATMARRLAPDPDYTVLDLGEFPLEKLPPQPPLLWPGCALLQGAMRPSKQPAMLMPVLRRLPSDGRFEDQALTYMMGKWELDDQALLRAYQQAKPDRGGKQMQGTIEKLIGMGRAEGRVLGQVELLTRMLNSKFGPLPKRVRGLLRKASLEELNAWAGVALDAKSLDAIFGKPPANP